MGVETFLYVAGTAILAAGAKEVYDMQQDAEEAAKEAKLKQRQARIDAMKDRKISTNAGSTPRRIIYGETRTGGQYVLEETSGDDSEYMHVICVFAAHQCEEIGDIYLDDSVLFEWDGSTHTLTEEFNGKAEVYFRLGDQGTAMPDAVNQIPSWTESDKLLGQTYIYVRFQYDEDIWDSRRMNLSAVIKGKNDILDPRTGLSGYTDNQALCSLDYLRWGRGMNINDAVIDFDSVKIAADVCDELVTKGAGETEKRYTVNGSVELNSPAIDTLQSLSLAGSSTWSRPAGRWFLISGAYSDAGAIELTEDDFIGGLDFSPRTEKSNLANIARGTFVDPEQNYEAVDFVHLAVDDYIQQDREELVQNLDFPWTNSSTMARRVSKIYLEKKRFGLVVTCTIKFKAIEIAPGDRVKLTVSDLGWNQRVFRVESMAIDVGSGVKLALKEDSPAVWEWTEGDALAVDAPPALNVPDPRFTPAPTDLAVTEELYSGAELGSIRVRAELSWLAGGVSNRSYDVQFKRATSSQWLTAATDLPIQSMNVDDLELGDYDFRVRAKNGIGVFSAWLNIAYTVLGKTAPPETVSSISANQTSEGVYVSWLPVNDLDLSVYELRYDEFFGSDNGMLYKGAQRFATLPPIGSQAIFYVRALDNSGNYSDQSAMLVFDPVTPERVNTLTADVIDSSVLLRWSESASIYPISNYRIYRGDTFDSASFIGESSGTFEVVVEQEGGTFRYWVEPVDFSGQRGEARAVIAAVDNPPDYILRRDDFYDLELFDRTNVALDFGGGSLPWDDTQLRWDDETLRWDDAPSYGLIGPVNTTETFAENMTRSGLAPSGMRWDDTTEYRWDDTTTPWDNSEAVPFGEKSENGHLLWISPPVASGFAEEIVDLGALIPSTRITVTESSDDLVPGASLSIRISVSADGISYTDFEEGQTVASATNFQFIKIRVTFTSDGNGIIRLNQMRFRLDVKQITDQGLATILASDPNGTEVQLNRQFLDIDSATATPKAIDAKIAVTDFDDVGNQDRIRIYVFDRATGDRVDATVNWIVRGS